MFTLDSTSVQVHCDAQRRNQAQHDERESVEMMSIESKATEQCVEDVLRAYIECALWASTDDDETPIDANYAAEDLAPEALEQMRADVEAFLETCWTELDLDLSPIEPAQIGHDFWLTRNHHGAGFWDRGLGELGDKLTELAHGYGDADLYVGDDGQLYL